MSIFPQEPPDSLSLLSSRQINERPELPFGDHPGIKRITEGFQIFLSSRTKPKEAQDLGNPSVGEPDRPGERPLRPEFPRLHRLRPLTGQEDRVPVGPDRIYPPHPPPDRLKDVVENVPDKGSLRHRTGELAKKEPVRAPFLLTVLSRIQPL